MTLGPKNQFSRDAQTPTTPQVRVDLSMADDITCDSCGNYTFTSVILMKKLSALVSPTGKEGIVPIESYACNACGFVNAQFLPPTHRDTGDES